MKLYLLILFFAFWCSKETNSLESYDQEIPGTELTIKMIPISGGSFLMGSPESESGRSPDEGPQHKVELRDFWMAEMETTWDLFHLFMERSIDENQTLTAEGKEVNIPVDGVIGATTPYTEMSFGMGKEGFPATSMTQLSAARFCEWLSAMTGKFYRLPTEAEWEYACRAGTDTEYSFGDAETIQEFAWYVGNTKEGYAQVGTKKPNPWGLYDMHGNVAEWTLDQYLPGAYSKYQGKLALSPWEQPIKTYPRVLKGGSWKDEAQALRSASRLASNKKWKKRDPQIPKSLWWHTDAPFIGFRVVRPVKTPRLDRQKAYWGHKK